MTVSFNLFFGFLRETLRYAQRDKVVISCQPCHPERSEGPHSRDNFQYSPNPRTKLVNYFESIS